MDKFSLVFKFIHSCIFSHSCLIVSHSKNRWSIVSTSILQKLHNGSFFILIAWRFLFVASILWIILYWNHISLVSFVKLKIFWALRSCFLSNFVEFGSTVSEEKSKMSRPIRGQGGHLVFPIGPKNTNLVEGFEILLPVKFRWILFSGFRGEVENVSANHRPGRPFCFSDPPEKHKLGRGHWDLASYQVLSNSFQRFQRRSRKCLSQSEARAAILFFPDWPENHKHGRRHWELASCQVSLNFVQRFLQRSRKCLIQSEARAAILFFQSAWKTQTW